MANIEEDWHSDIWNQIVEADNKYQKELQDKKDKYKEQLKGILEVETVWSFLNDNETWEPEGSVEIGIIEFKENGRHVAIDLSDKKRHFTRQEESVEEVGVDHVYCWQTNGFSGDDYSGWLLFPLTNGRYLRVRYTC